MSEHLKPGSIVKAKDGRVFQLIGTVGDIARLKDINYPYDETAYFVHELEVLMEGTGEAFDILFGDQGDS